MRIQSVVGAILRGGANDRVKVLQFLIRLELHKESLDKLVGLIHPKRFEVDRFAFVRRLCERFLGRSSVIWSDVNGHVWLENRRVKPPRELLDQALKKLSRWLRGHKPVSDDDSSGHNTAPELYRVDQTNSTLAVQPLSPTT